jgi:hypothetical protein
MIEVLKEQLLGLRDEPISTLVRRSGSPMIPA